MEELVFINSNVRIIDENALGVSICFENDDDQFYTLINKQEALRFIDALKKITGDD